MLLLGASETELSSFLCHANHKPAEVLGQLMQCLYAVVTSREDHKHFAIEDREPQATWKLRKREPGMVLGQPKICS